VHAHNANAKSDHVHMFLCILRAQELSDLINSKKAEITRGKEDVAVTEFLRDLAYQVHDMLGVRMHRLAVGEWESRFRLDSVGVANEAWRIVVMNPTGHTCTVHIYRKVQDTNKDEVVYQSPLSVVGPLMGFLWQHDTNPWTLLNGSVL
jgi:acetyl-CoA carboxylase/biotin carboxylase 1